MFVVLDIISRATNEMYTISRNMASLKVILLSVLTNNKKNMVESTKKKRAITNGEKSCISIGVRTATVPNTKVVRTMTEPSNSPSISLLFPCLAAVIAK